MHLNFQLLKARLKVTIRKIEQIKQSKHCKANKKGQERAEQGVSISKVNKMYVIPLAITLSIKSMHWRLLLMTNKLEQTLDRPRAIHMYYATNLCNNNMCVAFYSSNVTMKWYFFILFLFCLFRHWVDWMRLIDGSIVQLLCLYMKK